jgi:exonuclease VII small subunit
MSDEVTRLAARVDAVERALSDGETGLDGIEDAAALESRLAELESTADSLETRVAELEAGVQAVRGFAGGIRAANREVERRADLALSKVEALEPDRATDDVPARPTAATPGAASAGGTAPDADAGNTADRDGTAGGDVSGTTDAPGATDASTDTGEHGSPLTHASVGRTGDASADRRTDGGERDRRDARSPGTGERPPDGSGLADRLRELL